MTHHPKNKLERKQLEEKKSKTKRPSWAARVIKELKAKGTGYDNRDALPGYSRKDFNG